MVQIIESGSGAAPPAPSLSGQPNMDQVVQMVNAQSPEVWYQQAAWFDQVKNKLGDIDNGYRKESKVLEGPWQGKSSGAYEGQSSRVSSLIDQLHQGPDYAGVLRRAGDALTSAQQRVRDLQGQKAQHPDGEQSVYDQQARQILSDLGTAYDDVGRTLGQGMELEGVSDSGPVAPAPYSGAGKEHGGYGASQGFRGGSAPAITAGSSTGSSPFTVGRGGSGTAGAVTGTSGGVLGRKPGMRRSGMFGFGGEEASGSGTRWGEPKVSDSGVVTGTSGLYSLHGSVPSGKAGGKGCEGTGSSGEDQPPTGFFGSKRPAAPSTALGKSAKRSVPLNESQPDRLTDPSKQTATDGPLGATAKPAKCQPCDPTGVTGKPTTGKGKGTGTTGTGTPGTGTAGTPTTADPSGQTVHSQPSPQTNPAVSTTPQTGATTPQTGSNTPQPATSGSQPANPAPQPATSGSQPANTAPQPANPPQTTHTGSPPAETGAATAAPKVTPPSVGSGASAPDAPAITVASSVPASAVPAHPVPDSPNPASEMHLTIPAQAAASAGLPLHGAVPPLPVRTVGALSATSDGSAPAEAPGHAGHGVSPGTATTSGNGAPMMPIGAGAGAMAPGVGHHASAVRLSADPDAWTAAADAPLAVLGRPIRLPEPPSLPELLPADGAGPEPEGGKNG